MRRLLPLSAKAPKPPAMLLDWPNNGEVTMPLIGPGLTWLSRLRACSESVRL